MNARCIEPEDLGELIGLELGDPRLRHVRDCPRCGARLAAYQLFLSRRDAPPGVDLARAEARLREALRREMAAPARDIQVAPRAAGGMEWWRTIWTRNRLLAAAAAIAIVSVATLMLARLPGPGGLGGGTLRGSGERGAVAEIAVLPERLMGDGRIELRWRAVPGATEYEVRLSTTALEPAGRWTVRETLLIARPVAPAGTLLYWHVAALRNGRPVAESAPGTLRAP